jgi:two-component system, NarL family, response regulator LiaR
VGERDVTTHEHAAGMHRLISNSRMAIIRDGHGDYIGEMTTPQGSTLIAATVSVINKFLSEPVVRQKWLDRSEIPEARLHWSSETPLEQNKQERCLKISLSISCNYLLFLDKSSATTMTSLKHLFYNSRHLFLYGAVMAVLVFALKWLQWKYLITDNSSEIYLGLMAILFTLLGVWVATQLAKPKVQTIIVEKEVYLSQSSDLTINEAELKKLNLSIREYEVMQLLTQGHTNAEIAEKLFLSISTIKTHVSNLFIKMDVKNRAQVIEKANRLKIIP